MEEGGQEVAPKQNQEEGQEKETCQSYFHITSRQYG